MDIGNVKHTLVLDPQVVAEYLGEPFERFGDTIVILKRFAVDEAKHTLTRLSNIISWPETLLKSAREGV